MTLPVSAPNTTHLARPARPKQMRMPAFESALASAAQVVAHRIEQADPRPVGNQLHQVLAPQALDDFARLSLIARRQLLVRLGKKVELTLIGQKEIPLGCVLLIAIGPGHALRHPVVKRVVVKPLDDSLSAAVLAHAADRAQHCRQTRAHLDELRERRPMKRVDCLAADLHHEISGCPVVHGAQCKPCKLLAKRFDDATLARGHQDRDSAARQLLEGLRLLLIPHVIEDDEAAPVLEPPSDLVTQRIHPTTLEPVAVLWWHCQQLGEADQPLHRRAILAKLEPEDAMAKGAAHTWVEGEPVGGGRLAEACSAGDTHHRACTDDAHQRAIASDAIHEGGTQVPLLWARHVVSRQHGDIVHSRRLVAKELGRPGGEAAAAGSRVKAEAGRVVASWDGFVVNVVWVQQRVMAACWVHFGRVFRVNVKLELLHQTDEARIQVPGLRLRADRGACLLEGGWRLGSIGDCLCEGRAKYPTSCVFQHSLPADHVGHECPLAQRTGQTCGAAAGEHDQLKLAVDHMRPDYVDERINGHGLKSTTHADKGEDGLRL
eukprot:scaffold121397_cov69-Phaeocystis_antarctica.AAC.1